MHYVYILRDDQQKRYVGYSEDLKRRVHEHTHGGVITTGTFKNSKLLWYCAFADKKKALDFERYLKAGSGHAFAAKHLF